MFSTWSDELVVEYLLMMRILCVRHLYNLYNRDKLVIYDTSGVQVNFLLPRKVPSLFVKVREKDLSIVFPVTLSHLSGRAD